MAMVAGKTGSTVSDINVTPLIDVLLVLLIIFMVIVPVSPKGLSALVPQLPKQTSPWHDESDHAIVVQVLNRQGGEVAYKINEEDVSLSEMQSKLQSIFAARNNKTMFVKGDPAVSYGRVAAAIDAGHAAGVDHVRIITPRV